MPVPSYTNLTIVRSRPSLTTVLQQGACGALITQTKDRRIAKHLLRHGSSIPGPMECRRRIGKRRMTGTADVASEPLLLQEFYGLWSFPRGHDIPLWQWSAPKARLPMEGVRDTDLNSWLDIAELEEVSRSVGTEADAMSRIEGNQEFDMQDFRNNCRAFAAGSPSERHAVWTAFNSDYSRNIALGVIPDEWIESTILLVTECLKSGAADERQFAVLTRAFLRAFWCGVMESTVRHPHEMKIQILRTILELSAVQISEEDSQIMTLGIIASLSSSQIEQLIPTVSILVQQWVQALQSHSSSASLAKHQQDLTSLVSEAALSRLIKLLDTLGISASRQVIISVTNATLASGSASSGIFLQEKRLRLFCWLSAVARAASTTQHFLTTKLIAALTPEIVTKQWLGHPTSFLSLYDSCLILLDFWNGHNQLDSANIIKSHFRDVSIKEPGSPYRALLASILTRRKISWRKLAPIIQIITTCGSKHHLYRTLTAIQPGEIKTPPADIGDQIQSLSYFDPRAALHIFKLFRHRRHSHKSLTIDHMGSFVANLIHAPSVHASEVWSIVNLPVPRDRRTRRCNAVDPSRARMVQKMGVEFGRAKQLSRRSALRNVMLCIIYLRRRQQVVSPQLTRTLCAVGLRRDLDEQLSVGSSKVAWLLGLIEEAEGAAVSDLVDRLVYMWRQKFLR